MRLLWLSAGWIAIALGVAGLFLPLLPTTPFLLLAAAAFARGAPGLHSRLLAHPRLGPPIRDWQAHGAISRRAKLYALAAMAGALLLAALMRLHPLLLTIQAGISVAVAVFILTRPGGEDRGRES
jgi:uncharacterized membrane protein YbaN (DUF454 family)